MPSFRAITLVVITAAGAATAPGSAGAQTCSISSTAPGQLSCAVTTTVRLTVRIPAMVGVAIMPAAAAGAGTVVRADLSVKANRSYAVQVSRAPMDSPKSPASASSASSHVEWSTTAGGAILDDTPTQIDAVSAPIERRDPLPLAFAREPHRGMQAVEPVRLVLTVVAP